MPNGSHPGIAYEDDGPSASSGVVQALRQALEETFARMAATLQRPTVIASESGSDSISLKKLASGEIQWDVKWYRAPGESREQFIQNATWITDQIATFYHDHKPGESLAITLPPLPNGDRPL